MNIKKAASTALQDIPLISRSIQKTVSGQVSPGPDLKHAREFVPTSKDGKQGYYSKPFSPDDAGTIAVNKQIAQKKGQQLKPYVAGSATNATQAARKTGLLK